MAKEDEYFLPFSGEIVVAEGKKIFPKRIAEFNDRVGELIAQAARECFTDERVAEVTLNEMPSRTHCRSKQARNITASTYTISEWLCEVEEEDIEEDE